MLKVLIKKKSYLKAAFLGLLLPVLVIAKEDPYKKFNATQNKNNESIITWRVVDDVQKACEMESKKQKLGGFNYDLEACSFWKGDFCTIITGKQVDTFTLGHEARHCFQQNFHSQPH